MLYTRNLLVLLVLFATGCASTGRYQVGGPIPRPNNEQVMVVPVIDTKTGELYLYRGTSELRGARWEIIKANVMSGQIGQPD